MRECPRSTHELESSREGRARGAEYQAAQYQLETPDPQACTDLRLADLRHDNHQRDLKVLETDQTIKIMRCSVVGTLI